MAPVPQVLVDLAASTVPPDSRAAAGEQRATPARRLVPVLGFAQELVVRLLVLSWAITAGWFWLWWLSPERGGLGGWRLLTTVVLGWLFANASYGLFFMCRMTRPNPDLPVPRLRTAMVVTKAPSEPWSVLARTLDAMRSQVFPHPYDVWLADEDPSQETLDWCAAHGVSVSTRLGITEYHRAEWPRRTRSKEGNLAYFYDTVGYERYDVVAQLDADHIPGPTYLAEVVRPFADPSVGYVSAPSVCDANDARGWTVKGRLHKEAALHGPIQAGCNGGWAPVCIGSHYAVRTAALRGVGGLGPELAEDYSTTLWLQSGGWDGVFAIDAEAHGDGPESLGAMLTQEKQWARSLGVILTRWAPGRLRTAPWRARLRLGFALCHYLAQGLIFILGAVIPPLAVVTGASWGSTSVVGFYGHIWPSSLLLGAILWYLRRQDLLRPRAAKLWSLDLVLFQIIRWPWTTWGFVYGMWLGIRRRAPGFAVTPKGQSARSGLQPRHLVPTLVLGVVPAAAVVLVRHPGSALGLQIISAMQAMIYLTVVLAVIILDLRNQRPGPTSAIDGVASTVARWRRRPAAAPIGVAATVGLSLVLFRLSVVGLTP